MGIKILLENIKDEINYQLSGTSIGNAIENYSIQKEISKNNKRIDKILYGTSNPYEIEEKAQKKNDKAAIILAKAEERVIKKKKELEKEFSELRKHENILIAKITGNYDSRKNYEVYNKFDNEFFVDLVSDNITCSYNKEVFSIKGIFTHKYYEAEIEASKAYLSAERNYNHAQCISKAVDTFILSFTEIENTIKGEHELLSYFENSLEVISPKLVSSFEELINTAIANMDLQISKDHKAVIERLERIRCK